MIYYSVENFVADPDTLIFSSSEDALYIREYLYNGRPSKPFRFTGVGAAGFPEWICIEFDASKIVSLACVFNHNLTDLSAGADEARLKGCDLGCESGGCDWDFPDYEEEITDRLVANWNDLYKILNQNRLSFRFEFIDTTNPDGYIEVGELWLGAYSALQNAHLSPGRKESPKFYRYQNVTPYGQIWAESLSYDVSLDIAIKNVGSPSQIDDLRLMLMAIHANSGRFVLIPNHNFPIAYYVFLENEADFSSQLVGGLTSKLDDYNLRVRTLTKGISLL